MKTKENKRVQTTRATSISKWKQKMTTTISISPSNCIGRSESTKPLSRVERTKSFLKASLIKKWKSSKELFSRPLSSFTGNNDNANAIAIANANAARKKSESNVPNGKFINEKVLDNLDEFERNFLLSAGRKILVRELRKNFEKQPYVQSPDLNCDKQRIVVTVNKPVKKIAPKPPPPTPIPTIVDDKPKKYVNASVQTIPNYQEIKYAANATSPIYENQKKPSLVSRHSFYNTYRNEYCEVQNNHYASNLSIVSSYGVPSNSEKCLEKTLNKYRNSIKASSAVDLSSISTVVLNTAMPTVGKSSSMLKRHYSSIVNISHSNSSTNLTGSPIIDYSYDANEFAYDTSDRMMPTVIDKIAHKTSQLKPTHSMKSLNDVSPMINSTNNLNVRFRNGDFDTKSLIMTNTASILYDGEKDSDANAFQRLQFNRSVSKTDLYGSSVTIADANMKYNNINNNNNNNNITNNNNNNYECISSLNCHNMNLNNKSTMETNANHKSHDGNNNTTATVKIRKCCSINQIDLSLLKNELDEYIDRELRTTNFGRNTIAQRRFQFENYLKKVNRFSYVLWWQMQVFFPPPPPTVYCMHALNHL